MLQLKKPDEPPISTFVAAESPMEDPGEVISILPPKPLKLHVIDPPNRVRFPDASLLVEADKIQAPGLINVKLPDELVSIALDEQALFAPFNK